MIIAVIILFACKKEEVNPVNSKGRLVGRYASLITNNSLLDSISVNYIVGIRKPDNTYEYTTSKEYMNRKVTLNKSFPKADPSAYNTDEITDIYIDKPFKSFRVFPVFTYNYIKKPNSTNKVGRLLFRLDTTIAYIPSISFYGYTSFEWIYPKGYDIEELAKKYTTAPTIISF